MSRTCLVSSNVSSNFPEDGTGHCQLSWLKEHCGITTQAFLPWLHRCLEKTADSQDILSFVKWLMMIEQISVVFFMSFSFIIYTVFWLLLIMKSKNISHYHFYKQNTVYFILLLKYFQQKALILDNRHFYVCCAWIDTTATFKNITIITTNHQQIQVLLLSTIKNIWISAWS